MTSDTWDPEQYERFKAERSQPFFDLLSLVEPAGGRVLDLGCGTGALTRELHERTFATETVGVDSSDAMLADAAAHAGGGLRFEKGDIASLSVAEPVDVVFANAALQWVPDHERVLAEWTSLLAPGGQLAVQVPANVDHPSHRIIQELATEAPYVDAGDGPPPPDPVFSVLRPEAYAELLHRLGFTEQHVRLQVYGHVLDSTAAVVEWTKGTSLTRMARHFPPDVYDAFVDEYRRRLVAELGDERPYFYAFKRILFWARR
jgi:trans-aconitate 2-methyltransferase